MARYIDVDGYRKLFDRKYKETRKLILRGETHLDNLAEGFTEAGRVIDSISTADVVPVVRCKDCKYAEVCETQCGAKYIECQSHEVYMEADDYCSYGERKSEEVTP